MLVMRLLFFGAPTVAILLAVLPLLRRSLTCACGKATRWGLGLGVVGLLGGMFGPALFVPSDAIQAPLIGIFFTGPAGFILGAIAGFFWGVFRSPRPETTDLR